MSKETQISSSIYIKQRIEHCWPFLVDHIGLGEGDWTFSWVVHKSIHAVRHLMKGEAKEPWTSEEAHFKVTNATRDGFQLNIQHVYRFDRALLAVFFLPFLKQKARAIERQIQRTELFVAAYQQSSQTASFPAAAQSSLPADPATETLADRLQSLTPGTKLSALLAEAVYHWPDRFVAAMCPYALAQHWGAKPADVIHLMLRAAADRVLELHWEVRCPSCRRAARSVKHLRDILAPEKCPYCLIDYPVDWDKNVIALFSPHPDIRRLTPKVYPVGHPSTLPHLLAQTQIDVGHPRSLRINLEEDEYLIFSPQRTERYKIVVQSSHSKEAYVPFGEGFQSASISLAPGDSQLSIELHPDDRKPSTGYYPDQIEIRLEKRDDFPARLTAFEAVTNSEFQRWFPEEKPRQGVSWYVEQVTILFCDIWHSTALYQTIGDEAAIQLVEEHIDFVRRETAGAGGTVVKLLGDTVMCAFQTAEQGLTAALGIHRKHEGRDQDKTTPFEIKIGLYSGPAYIILANGQLDFFGHTVNMASWAHQAAARGEIVVGDVIYERPENKRMLQRQLITAHPFLQHIPGSTVSERLYNIKLP